MPAETHSAAKSVMSSPRLNGSISPVSRSRGFSTSESRIRKAKEMIEIWVAMR